MVSIIIPCILTYEGYKPCGYLVVIAWLYFSDIIQKATYKENVT